MQSDAVKLILAGILGARRDGAALNRPMGDGRANAERLIPSLSDQNLWAQSRRPMDMMRQGWAMSLFQAEQQ